MIHKVKIKKKNWMFVPMVNPLARVSHMWDTRKKKKTAHALILSPVTGGGQASSWTGPRADFETAWRTIIFGLKIYQR